MVKKSEKINNVTDYVDATTEIYRGKEVSCKSSESYEFFKKCLVTNTFC